MEEMNNSDEREEQILSFYRSLTEDQKDVFLQFLDTLKQLLKEDEESSS